MTFSLLYPFQILCVLFLPISAFFLLKLLCLFPESVSLACLASSSSPPSPFFLSGTNLLVELAWKRLLRRLPFLLFLHSWRSFCDEAVIFAKCLFTILQTSIEAPLLFQNVPRANDPTIYAGYSCWIPLSLPLQLIPHSSGLFLPSPFLSLRFRLPSITFSTHSTHSNSNSEQIPFGMSSLMIQLFLISFNFSHSSTKKPSFLVRISVFNKFFMGTPHSSRPTE